MARSHDDKYRRPADDPDYDWLQPPGIFCDTFSADYYPNSKVIRVTLGEWVSNEHYPIFRTAVVMTLDDARALSRRLNRLVRDAEEEQAKEANTPKDESDA